MLYWTCGNSPYRNEAVAMPVLKEIITRYSIKETDPEVAVEWDVSGKIKKMNALLAGKNLDFSPKGSQVAFLLPELNSWEVIYVE